MPSPLQSFRLPQNLLDSLEAEAKVRQVHKSDLIKLALTELLGPPTPEGVSPKSCACGRLGEWAGAKCPACIEAH